MNFLIFFNDRNATISALIRSGCPFELRRNVLTILPGSTLPLEEIGDHADIYQEMPGFTYNRC